LTSDAVVMRRHDDGRVEVLEAPTRATFSLELLVARDLAATAIIGGLLIIADQVAYRPVAFDRRGDLVCERVPWKEENAAPPVAALDEPS